MTERLVIIDPSFHKTDKTTATVYRVEGKFKLVRTHVYQCTETNLGVQLVWLKSLYTNMPFAKFKIEANGGGEILLDMFEAWVNGGCK